MASYCSAINFILYFCKHCKYCIVRCSSHSSVGKKQLLVSIENYKLSGIIDLTRMQWKILTYWSRHSQSFCNQLLGCFKSDVYILVRLREVPLQASIDFIGSNIAQAMVAERAVCDTLMSYLSTLGGAFSALGDNFQQCAEQAGKISLKQMKIAWRLQEEPLIARCWLFLSLSLIQQGYLKRAKHIIKAQFEISKQFDDTRLTNMCRGVWSKLRYEIQKKRLADAAISQSVG